MLRLGIVTLLWRRRRLSENILRWYSCLEIPGVEFYRVAVSSPEDPERIDYLPGWNILWERNDLISRKWNLASSSLRRIDPDGIVIIGSDDLLGSSYFEKLKCFVSEGYDYVTPTGVYVVNSVNMECMYLSGVRVGAGRFIARRLLNRVNWRPWANANRGLDGAMDRRLYQQIQKIKQFDPRDEGILLVDVKSEVNMWPYSEFVARFGQIADRVDPLQFDEFRLILETISK